MRSIYSCLVAAVVTLAVFSPVRGDEALPADVLDRIKASAVLLGIQPDQAGSGFLAEIEGGYGYCFTNARWTQTPNFIFAYVASNTAKPQRVSYKVASTDKNQDLAILRPHNPGEMPRPLSLSAKTELKVGMTVYALGFDVKTAVQNATNGRPISPVVVEMKIAALVTNERGEVTSIEVDNSKFTDPKQPAPKLTDPKPPDPYSIVSGGPVFDQKGNLIGMAVAKPSRPMRAMDIAIPEVNLVVPARELRELVEGRVADLSVRVIAVKDGFAEVEMRLTLSDPLSKIGAGIVRFAPAASIATPIEADKTGAFAALPNGDEIKLPLKDQSGMAKISIKVNSKELAGGPPLYTFQVIYTRQDGTVVRSQPSPPLNLGFGRAFVKVAPPTLLGAKPPTNLTPPVVSGEQEVTVEKGDTWPKFLKYKSLSLEDFSPFGSIWGPDATSFYCLDTGPHLRRFSFPDLKEEAVQRLDRRSSMLCLSSLGVLAAFADVQEARLFDAVTLKEIRRIPIDGFEHIAAAPGSSFAYACASKPLERLMVIDLKSGKTIKELRGYGFKSFTLSADGKYGFGLGAKFGFLVRFKIDGSTVDLEERTTDTSTSYQQIVGISNDGKWIGAVAAGNDPNLHIFQTANLKAPAVRLVGSRTVAIDTTSHFYFAANQLRNFVVVSDAKGAKLAQFPFDAKIKNAQLWIAQLLVHPDGGKLLLVSDFAPKVSGRIHSIEYPAK